MTPVEAHDVTVAAPWYAPGRAVALHRYLDSKFVDLFRAEVSAAPEQNSALFAWQSEDALPSPNQAVLKLRRPLHRCFYVAAWEATCTIPNAVMGQPPIDPAKISSAGFVLRQGDASAPQGFLLAAGKPTGWAAVEPGVDPDAARQVKALGLVPATAKANPGYTGEETFPLHKMMVGTSQHTVVYGFLPIGGAEYVPPNPVAADPSTLPDDLVWPYGLADRSGGPPAGYASDSQIAGGAVQTPLAALLRVLLGRYGLALAQGWADPANAVLTGLLGQLSFFADPPAGLSLPDLRNWAFGNVVPGQTLGSVLSNADTASALLTALGQADPAKPMTLPAKWPVPAGSQNLLVPEATAAQIRAAVRARLVQVTQAGAADMPIPKLTAGPTGRYYLVPFVRTLRPDGCERVSWGPPSEAFAVATAFDPDASRPQMIQMPDITDVKAGLGKGVSLNMPAGLANVVNGTNTATALQPSGLNIGFICSFSLPAITICATIALSIILSLLNITLGWMAWVKICLPAPKRG